MEAKRTSSEILKKGSEIKSNDTRMSHDFFQGEGRGEWREFEKHAEIISQFMGTSDSDMAEMLEALKKAFVALAGEMDSEHPNNWSITTLDAGLKKLQNLDKIFADAGIKGLDPAIRASKFLDLLSPFYKKQVAMNIDDPNNPGKKKRVTRTKELPMDKEYDISTFIKMIEARQNRKLEPLIKGKSSFKLGNILSRAFKDSDQMLEQMEIFRKIVNQGGYSKNNASVGKGEIAIAMFFGDCALPDDRGDINLNNHAIEIKGNDAGITERTTIHKPILNMTLEQAKGLLGGSISDKIFTPEIITKYGLDNFSPEKISPEEMFEKIQEWSKLHYTSKQKIDDIDSNEFDSVSEAKKSDKSMSWTEDHGFLFCLIFGMLARAYFKKFDSMLIINTSDDISKDISMSGKNISGSNLLSSNVVRLAKSNKPWYIDGINLLNALDNNGLKVAYQNRSNEGTFKAIFNN